MNSAIAVSESIACQRRSEITQNNLLTYVAEVVDYDILVVVGHIRKLLVITQGCISPPQLHLHLQVRRIQIWGSNDLDSGYEALESAG